METFLPSRTTLHGIVGHNSGESLKLTYETAGQVSPEQIEDFAFFIYKHFESWKRTVDPDMKCCVACFLQPQAT